MLLLGVAGAGLSPTDPASVDLINGGVNGSVAVCGGGHVSAIKGVLYDGSGNESCSDASIMSEASCVSSCSIAVSHSLLCPAPLTRSAAYI